MDATTGSAERRALASRMMRRQARLSLQLAAVFVAVLVALPLVNLMAPGLAAIQVGGFTLTWLLLGVLFYPFTVLLSAIFVRGSDAIESEIVASEIVASETAASEIGVRESESGESVQP